MGTLKEKLEYIAETKEAIKDAIESKGVDVSSTATFRSYADNISSIPTGSQVRQFTPTNIIYSSSTVSVSGEVV